MNSFEMNEIRPSKIRASFVLSGLLALILTGCAGEGAKDEPLGGDESNTLGGLHASSAVVTGTVVDAVRRTAVVGATVAAGPISTTTDSAGHFTLNVPTGIAARPTVRHPKYAQHLFESLYATDNTDQGALPMLSLDIQGILRSTVGYYDATLGALAVRVLHRGACATEDGATIQVSPAGSSRVVYFRNGTPSNEQTVQAGQETSAFVYNLAVGQNIALKVARSGCTQAPYPVSDHGATRTGDIVTEPGDSLTFATAFLE